MNPKNMINACTDEEMGLKGSLFTGLLVPSNVRLPGIHGLRAMAALIVLFTHVGAIIQMMGYRPPNISLIELLYNIGVTGVHLFFVLSAFSLANSTTLTPDGIAEYGIKRFFRIAPLYYAMIIFQLIWRGPAGVESHGIPEIFLNFVFLFNLAPKLSTGIVYGGWTIGVEMIFYAVLPFVLLVCRKTRGMIILAAFGLLISWAAHVGISDSDPAAQLSPFTNYATFSFLTNIAPFCVGLLAFRLYKEFAFSVAAARIFTVLSIILFVAIIFSPISNQFGTSGRPALLVLFIIYGLLSLSQSISPSLLTSNVVMQHIGERSFSVYLVQLPVIWMIAPLYSRILNYMGGYTLYSYLACTALTLPIVLFVANLTYHLVEIPGVNIGRTIIAKRRDRFRARLRHSAPAGSSQRNPDDCG